MENVYCFIETKYDHESGRIQTTNLDRIGLDKNISISPEQAEKFIIELQESLTMYKKTIAARDVVELESKMALVRNVRKIWRFFRLF